MRFRPRARDRYREAADAAGRTDHEHATAGTQPPLVAQRLQRADARRRRGRRDVVTDSGWLTCDRLARYDDALGERALLRAQRERQKAEHLVAGAQVGHAGGTRVDNAREVVARDER